jgi:hypothetical protein
MMGKIWTFQEPLLELLKISWQIVFGGEYDIQRESFEKGSVDFPILDGTGSYLGIIGEVDIFRDGIKTLLWQLEFVYIFHPIL